MRASRTAFLRCPACSGTPQLLVRGRLQPPAMFSGARRLRIHFGEAGGATLSRPARAGSCKMGTVRRFAINLVREIHSRFRRAETRIPTFCEVWYGRAVKKSTKKVGRYGSRRRGRQPPGEGGYGPAEPMPLTQLWRLAQPVNVPSRQSLAPATSGTIVLLIFAKIAHPAEAGAADTLHTQPQFAARGARGQSAPAARFASCCTRSSRSASRGGGGAAADPVRALKLLLLARETYRDT